MPKGYRILTQQAPPTVLGHATTRSRAERKAASLSDPSTIAEEEWDVAVWNALRAEEIAQQRVRDPFRARPRRVCPPRFHQAQATPHDPLAALWWTVHEDCRQWYRNARATATEPLSNQHPMMRRYGRLLRTLSRRYHHEVLWQVGDGLDLSPRLMNIIITGLALVFWGITSRWIVIVDLRHLLPLPWQQGFPRLPRWTPFVAGVVSLAGIVNHAYHAVGGAFLTLAGWPWWPDSRRLARMLHRTPGISPISERNPRP